MRRGVAVIAATRDGALRPEIARGWGPEVSENGKTVTLCLAGPLGSQTHRNLEENGAIAVTFSLPTTYRTVQVKGISLDVREPSADRLARVDEHVAAFIDEVEQVGVPRSIARTFLDRDLVAVRFGVREIYEGTPGPRAGTPL